MINYFKKIGAALLLLSIATTAMAQVGSFKTLTEKLQTLQKELVPDKRVAILDIQLKDTLQKTITVIGETNLPEAKTQITNLLSKLNIEFIDSIRVLPDALVGDKTWALATLSVSNIRAKPDHVSEMVSQAMMGTPMKVLDVKDKWYRVQTPDNYIGWMDAGGLQRISSNELEQWKHLKRYLFNHLSGFAYNTPSSDADIVSDLVLGDLFEMDSVEKHFLKIKTPDGRIGYIKEDDCLSFDDWGKITPTAQAVLTIAKQMMGSPYLWGGVSYKGVDCSGLVKLSYYSQGVIVARDASQQAKCGKSVDFNDISNLQPGDLLFFGTSAQHITHVAIYLAQGDFIHSSGRVHISSIVPTDPKFVPTRHTVAACRVINSLDTEGIISVRKHPWYSVQP